MPILKFKLQMAGIHCYSNSRSSNELTSYSTLFIRQRVNELSQQVSPQNTVVQAVILNECNPNRDKYATQAINETTFQVCF